MYTVSILIKTLSINTVYIFHSMHSLYSFIQYILETNFSYVLCRWMIDEIQVLDGEVQFVVRGGGDSLSYPMRGVLRGGKVGFLKGGEVAVLRGGEVAGLSISREGFSQ